MYTLEQIKHLLWVYYGLEKDSKVWEKYEKVMKDA